MDPSSGTLTINAFAGLGALIGDPARAGMLLALMDGRALTAGELAAVAGVTPQTASAHLARLVAAGLLAVAPQGRHRYHRLATPAVAQLVEGMMGVAATTRQAPRLAPRTGPRDQALRQARTCYDHLAGRVAVAITDALLARGAIEFGADGGALTPAGAALVAAMGLTPPPESPRRARVFCRPCLDWSERRPHLAGALGASLYSHGLARDWLRRSAHSRVVTVTPTGQLRLTALLGLDPALWRPAS